MTTSNNKTSNNKDKNDDDMKNNNVDDNSMQNGVSDVSNHITVKDKTNKLHGIYPTFIKVPEDRPWMASYEKYKVPSTIEMPDADTSLLEVFERNFKLYSNRDAFICMGSTITYRQLDLYSRQIAAYLQSLGLKKGDAVAVMMPNILQYPIVALGILRAGMILVNVNPLYTSYELEHQLQDSGAKAIFLIENFAKTYQDVEDKGDIEHIVLCSVGDMLGAVKGRLINAVVRHVKRIVPKYSLPDAIKFNDALNKVSASQYQRPTLDLSHVALFQYTGGTTGLSKGAMLTHGNLIANMLQIEKVVEPRINEIDENDVMLVCLPLYHVFSFMLCGMYTMYGGFAGLLIPNPRDLDELVKQLDKYQPAFMPAVNTLFNGLVHHDGFKELDFSKLKIAIGGGTSVLQSVAKQWHEITGTPIIEGYGLSETSPLVSVNPLIIEEYNGTIGIPVPSTDVVLIDDDGNYAPLGERGEISVKGPQVMVGYLNQPEETKSSFNADGYLKTGDIGVVDEQGFIKIVDRKKDMILVSGFNVFPNEIEEAMSQHPAVLEVGAIGIESKERGEEPKIFVVKKSEVSEKELISYGKKHLTGYKRPRHVEFVDELPKSSVGKILRKELRKMEDDKQSK